MVAIFRVRYTVESEKFQESAGSLADETKTKAAPSSDAQVLVAADSKLLSDGQATPLSVGTDPYVQDLHAAGLNAVESEALQVQGIAVRQEVDRHGSAVSSTSGEVDVAEPELDLEQENNELQKAADVEEVVDYEEIINEEEARVEEPQTADLEEQVDVGGADDLEIASAASCSEDTRYFEASEGSVSSVVHVQGSVVTTSAEPGRAGEVGVLAETCATEEGEGEQHRSKAALVAASKAKKAARWSIFRSVLRGLKSPKAMPPTNPSSEPTEARGGASLLEQEEEKRVILEQDQILQREEDEHRQSREEDGAAVPDESNPERQEGVNVERVIESCPEEEPSSGQGEDEIEEEDEHAVNPPLTEGLQVSEDFLDPVVAVNWGVPSRVRKCILEDVEEMERRHMTAELFFEDCAWSQSSRVAAYCDDVDYQLTEDDDSDTELLFLDPAIGVDWSLPALLREEILENADPLQFERNGYSDLMTLMVTCCSGQEQKGFMGSLLRSDLRGSNQWHEAQQQQQWLLSRGVPVSLKYENEPGGPVDLASPSESLTRSEEKQVILHHRGAGSMVLPLDMPLPERPEDSSENEVESPQSLVQVQASDDSVNAGGTVGDDHPTANWVSAESSPLSHSDSLVHRTELGDTRAAEESKSPEPETASSELPSVSGGDKASGLGAQEMGGSLLKAPMSQDGALSWKEKKIMGMNPDEDDNHDNQRHHDRPIQVCEDLKEDLERGKVNSVKLLHENKDVRSLLEERERSLRRELVKAAREREGFDSQLRGKDAELVRVREQMERREKEVEAMETTKIRALMRRLNQMEAHLNEEEDKRLEAERREAALARELAELKDVGERESQVLEKLRAAEGRVIQLEAIVNARGSTSGGRRVRTVTRRRIMRGGKLVREELISEPERVVPLEEGSGDSLEESVGELSPSNTQDSEVKPQEAELALKALSLALAEAKKDLDGAERRAKTASRAAADAEARAEALEGTLTNVQRKLRSWHRIDLIDDSDLLHKQEFGGEGEDVEVPEGAETLEGKLQQTRMEVTKLRKVNAEAQSIAESRGLAFFCLEQKVEESNQRVEELEETLRSLKQDLNAVVEAKLRAEVEADQRREEWEAAVRDVEAQALALREMQEQMREGEGRVKDLERILEERAPPGSRDEMLVDLKRRLMETERRAETLFVQLQDSGNALAKAERSADAANKEAERSREELKLVEEKANALVLGAERQAEQARKRMADAFDLMMVEQQKRTQVQEEELAVMREELNQKRLRVEELEEEKQQLKNRIEELAEALEEAKVQSGVMEEMEARIGEAEKRAKDAELRFKALQATVRVAEAEGAVVREALERAEQEAEMRRQDLEMAMKEVQAAEERIREVEEVREEAERCAEELVEDVEARAQALQTMEERAERAERKGVILAMALSAVEWKVQEVEKKASADVASLRELRAGLEIKVVALEGALREVEDALRASLEESAEVKNHAALLGMALMEADEQAQEAKERSLLIQKALDTACAKLVEANKKSEAIVDQLEKVQKSAIAVGDATSVEGVEEHRQEEILHEKVDALQRTLRDTEILATELWRTCKVAEDDLEQWMIMLEDVVRASEARAEEREGRAQSDLAAMAERKAGFEKRAEVLEAALVEVESALKDSKAKANEAMGKVESLEHALAAADERARAAERRAEDANQRADEKAEIARRIAEMGSAADAANIAAAAGGKKSVMDERIRNALTEATMAKAESDECRRKLHEIEQLMRETEERVKEGESPALRAARQEADSLRARVQELEGTVEWVEQARAAAAVEMLAAESIRLPHPDGEDDSGKRMEALSRQQSEMKGKSFPFDEGEVLNSLPAGWWQTNWPGLIERSPLSSSSSKSVNSPASPPGGAFSPLRRRALFLGSLGPEGNANSPGQDGSPDPSGKAGKFPTSVQGSPGAGKGEAGHKAWIEYLLEGQQGREDQMNANPSPSSRVKTKVSAPDQTEHLQQAVVASSR
ncbi:hypothetical protein CBR_g814 [Chara braunii]|uniref:Uncharacterized protein n=1 Tax=Chara braunii TaxID=69332 RepID=A0A388KCF6_CHABU|nr:hypothetical protein CBR_g814 [Chara braunii]|eukprot:GBG67686.1 hypothetical protein CBR_g814 [Chara braunii]